MSALRRVFVALLLAGLTFALAFAAVRLRLPVPTITLTTGALFLIAGWFAAPLALRLRHPAVLVAAVVGLLLAFLPLLWVVAGFSSHAINNWRLSAFAEQFLSSPPPGISPNLVRADVGVLTGNGNHCDFIVSISFQDPAEANAAIRHYESLAVQHAIPGSSSEIQLALEGPQASRLTATDAPNEAAFDIRCH
ncbi:MAG: hypothetical protein M5U32_02340 [Myxococcota bacterium]|nr:hypothetical protein [Myxococcota bacterium]